MSCAIKITNRTFRLTPARREAGSVILKITYGYTTEARGKDPFVDLAGKTMVQFAEATVPGKWIVDILPFCKATQVEACKTSNWIQ